MCVCLLQERKELQVRPVAKGPLEVGHLTCQERGRERWGKTHTHTHTHTHDLTPWCNIISPLLPQPLVKVEVFSE